MQTQSRTDARAAAASPRARASLRHRISFWLVLAAFCGMSLAWSVVATVLRPFLPRRLGATIGQYMIMLAFRGGLS